MVVVNLERVKQIDNCIDIRSLNIFPCFYIRSVHIYYFISNYIIYNMSIYCPMFVKCFVKKTRSNQIVPNVGQEQYFLPFKNINECLNIIVLNSKDKISKFKVANDRESATTANCGNHMTIHVNFHCRIPRNRNVKETY